MTKHTIILLALSCFCMGLIGCSGGEPPKKTTIEKLNSDDANERMEGVEEADKKYGGDT